MIVTESKPNTCYLTAGGYLITLKGVDGYLFAPLALSPGLTHLGRSVYQVRSIGYRYKGYGWVWEQDGTIKNLQDEWIEKLRIIKELKGNIPELPAGYKWKDGFPRIGNFELGTIIFRTLTKSGYYLENIDKDPHTSLSNQSYWSLNDVGSKRLLLEKEDKMEVTLPKTDDKYAQYAQFPVEVKAEIFMEAHTSPQEDNNVATVTFSATKDSETPNIMANPIRQSWLSYFVSEPLSNTYKFVKPSFRYALLYSVIGFGVYTATHFEAALSLIKSCLPKINIEWRNK